MKTFCLTCNAQTIHHHMHDTAHDLSSTHMVGTERWICDACGHTTYAKDARKGSDFVFVLDNGGNAAQTKSGKHNSISNALGIEQPGALRLDQLAYYCSSEEAEAKVKAMYGLQNAVWIKDAVTARGTVNGKQTVNVALLQFNSDLGIQLEMIKYRAGDHWLRHFVGKREEPFVAHVGVHLNCAEWPKAPGKLVQEVKTISHTAEHLTIGAQAGRRYHYRIYQLSDTSCVKFIKRIEK